MSIVAVAVGVVAAAVFLSLTAAAAYFTILRRRGSATPSDLEKGLPSARVADGPDLPAGVTPAPEKKTDRDDGKTTVQKFAWGEVEAMTENFTSAVVGEGCYSTVYLARFSGGSLGAVKVYRSGGGSERLLRAFRQELDVLRRLRRHPHLVRLLGFCDDREEGVLVFEYVPNGTLHERLHGGDAIAVLPWAHRMAVALQIARAVEYLHDGCALQIVHCDIKASNVLLDSSFDCKLCDFGSARIGFESTVHQSPMMMGSPGYVDPHYLRTGIVSKKGDVYSFGVLLLELVTGIEAFCSEKEQMLTAAVGGVIRDGGGGVEEMVDPRLAGEFDAAEAAAVAAVAARCVGEQPSLRPSMAEIVRIIGEMASGSISAVDTKSCG